MTDLAAGRSARALLETHGPGAVTIEAVAARSGVSKPTIYRTWPNAHAVVMAALMESPLAPSAVRRQGPALAALRHQLRDIARTFDVDVTLDLLYGPIFFRILVGHAAADEGFCERLLDQLVGGLATARGAERRNA
jgi:AcrR family transcriptional regulator